MSDVAPNRGKVVRMPTGASTFGPFRFESRTGRLSRGDAEIHLTPRASNVLGYLIAHRGEVVSKDELFAEVWKAVSVTDDALLQVVSVVRKALGDDPRRPDYIQTVTGEGYRFIADVRDVPPVNDSAVADKRGGDPSPAGRVSAAPVLVVPAAAEAQRRSRVVIGLVLVVSAVAVWLLWSGAFDNTLPGGADQQSIAVLPFLNLTGDPANDYLSDGLAEELVSVLGAIDGLRVAARTSSFSFRDRQLRIGEIGRLLNVGTILEGSARKDGDLLYITVRLFNVGDERELWQATYDREFADVFAIQQEIASQVAQALAIPLLGQDAVLLARGGTTNLQAYEAYLQGKHFLSRYTVDAFRAAATNFERAIALDPNFARAHVGLADAYLLQNSYGVLAQADALAVAEPAIARALELDDRLGEAHAISGLIMELRRDIPGATAAYERAIALDPNSARAYQLYWWMLFTREGDSEQTRQFAEKALLADPLSPAQNENFGWSLFQVGRFDEALGYFEKSIELESAYPFGHNAIGAFHESLGDIGQAIDSYETAVVLSPETGKFHENLGRAYAMVGRTDEAVAEFGEIIGALPEHGGPYGRTGRVYWEVLGRPDQAVGWYRQAIEQAPDNARLRTMLALVYLDLGDEESAQQLITSAIETEPDDLLAQVGLLNVYMYGTRYAESADFGRGLARTAQFPGYLFQFRWPYADFAPLGYFGALAGEPDDALVFLSRAFPQLRGDSPVVNRFNINAAIDIAAVLKLTGDDGQAELLLRRSQEFIDAQPEDLRRVRYREEPAEIYALRGMVPEALAALRAAVDQGWRRGWWRARFKPHYEALRGDPEFEAILMELQDDAARMRDLLR